MNKNYIAPQVEVSTLGVQTIICASAAGPAGTPDGSMGLVDQETNQQW